MIRGLTRIWDPVGDDPLAFAEREGEPLSVRVGLNAGASRAKKTAISSARG